MFIKKSILFFATCTLLLRAEIELVLRLSAPEPLSHPVPSPPGSMIHAPEYRIASAIKRTAAAPLNLAFSCASATSHLGPHLATAGACNTGPTFFFF
jgi:hypothetical protein